MYRLKQQIKKAELFFKKEIRARLYYSIRSISLFRRALNQPSNSLITTRGYIKQSQRNGSSAQKPSLSVIHRPRRIPIQSPSIPDHLTQPEFRLAKNFNLPTAFVATLPGARLYGKGVAIITPDNRVLSDISVHLGGDTMDHDVMRHLWLPRARRIAGVSAVLSTPSGNTYYHWLFDLLPRIELLKLAGRDLSEINHFVVNSLRYDFQRDSLALCGIDLNKVIESDRQKHLLLEKMVLPSLPGISMYPPRWACDFLVKTLLKTNVGSKGNDRLYISRRRVTERRVLNEAEIESLLAELGFRIIYPEDYSITQQADLFWSAAVVIGPHGSGLANVVFCRPGTKVIELHHPVYTRQYFGLICRQMDLDYHYLIGDLTTVPEQELHFVVNKVELQKLLKRNGLT